RRRGERHHAGDLAHGLGHRPVHGGPVVALRRGHHHLQAIRPGGEGRRGAAGGAPSRRLIPANPWSVPAIAGPARGETNEPTSMRRTPVSESASTRRTRASTGTGGSFWRPSRGATSRVVTEDGNCHG